MRLSIASVLLGVSVVAFQGCGSNNPSAPQPPEYELEVRWLGDAPAQAVQESFSRAANRIRSIITGGLSPVLLPPDFNLDQCSEELAGFPDIPEEAVEGLIIYVLVEEIDGPGQILGSAGPCLVRAADQNKPALGVMRLDEDDLAAITIQSRLDALILHEALHVVGFGTVWEDNGLLQGVGGDDAQFIGTAARGACRDQNGGVNTCATAVPVHSADGPGSAYSHWREGTFTNELMTPFLNAGAAPLSAMSIRSLGDLGYEISASSADAFVVAAGLVAGLREEPAGPVIELPAPRAPRFKLTPTGTLVPIVNAR